MAEKDFNYYRSQFFADPKTPVDSRFAQSTNQLLHSLVGVPDAELPSQNPNSEFENFTITLIQKMMRTRFFDHLSMAQLHPNGNMPAEIAHLASTLRNNNTIVHESAPVETSLEQEVITWLLKEVARFDESKGSGAITTGGTLANLTGMMIAREKLINEKGWNGRSPVRILTTPMAHYSISKASRILGPAGLIETVNVDMEDGGYKMDTVSLYNRVQEANDDDVPIMAIVAVAGETETGLVDPLERVVDIADDNSIYLHVDGAYGGPFVLGRKKPLFEGMQYSNSLTIDPHKYMYTPYSAGSILFRDADDHSYITGYNEGGNGYLFKDQTKNYPGLKRLEGSMGGQGVVAALAVIETLGVEGLKFILDHTIDLTDHGYRKIVDSPFFTPAYQPELNTVCFFPTDSRVEDQLSNPLQQAAFVEAAREELEEKTGIYISTTTLLSPDKSDRRRPIKVFRLVPTHPFTEEEHVSQALDSLNDVWDKMVNEKLKT